MAKKRVRFHEHGLHDDIRYSGPLSFQSFQVLGWLCIVLTVVLTLMKIGMRLNPNETQKLATVRTVIEYFADLHSRIIPSGIAQAACHVEGIEQVDISYGT